MADFFEYLDWRGDITLEEIPFTPVDILLLSHLTYSIFDGLISDSFDESITLNQLGKNFKLHPEYEKRSDIGVLINKKTMDLLIKASKSKRFKNIKLCGYVNKFDKEKVEQFAAVTFLAGDKKIVSYRGTDDTIVGWHEDFNLACMDEIPSQKDGLEYFRRVAEKFSGNFTIIGHSKGGNLALNTGIKCGPDLQKRIDAIYNFDGPGFQKEVFESREYKNIEKIVYSFYPQFSVVGMIFSHPEKYKILKSTGFAIMEHDAVTWQLMGRDFITVKKFDETSSMFNAAFNDWVAQLTVTERKKFVDALFKVIYASGAETLAEINNSAISSSAKMLAAFTSMDKETRKEVHRIIGLFKNTIHTEFPLFKIFDLKNKL